MLIVVEESVEHVVATVLSGQQHQHLLAEWVDLEERIETKCEQTCTSLLSTPPFTYPSFTPSTYVHLPTLPYTSFSSPN